MIRSIHDNFGQNQVFMQKSQNIVAIVLKIGRFLKFLISMALFLPAYVHQRITEGLPVTGPCSDVQIWNERQNRFVRSRRRHVEKPFPEQRSQVL
jgi:hypothetical protein